MKLHYITAKDIPDAWFQLVDLCYREGRDYIITKGSYQGSFRRELDYVTFLINYPCTLPRTMRIPTVPPQYGIPDPIPEGIEYVDRYIPYLMTDAITPGEEYTYGSRLMGINDLYGAKRSSQVDEVIRKYNLVIAMNRKAGTHLEIAPSDPQEALGDYVEPCGVVDCHTPSAVERGVGQERTIVLCKKHAAQVDKCELKRNFATNQLSMTIAMPSDIHLKNSPCLREIGTRIYEPHHEDGERLNFFIDFRSWDLWSGTPANLCALADLLEFMAMEIGVRPGVFVCKSQGLHLYDMYWELARIRLGINHQNEDTRKRIEEQVADLQSTNRTAASDTERRKAHLRVVSGGS